MQQTSNLLSGRLAFQCKLKGTSGAPRWVATESGSGRRLVVALVSPAKAHSLAAATGVAQRHLAGVIEIIKTFDPSQLPKGIVAAPGAELALAEYVPGRTLAELSKEKVSPVKAVAFVLRLIEAVQALHERGAVHGCISPWSVVVEPEGRGIAPVLSQLVAPPIGAYCPPERLKGGPAAASDDVWALHATLYTALTGKQPFDAVEQDSLVKRMLVGRAAPLAESGLNEPALAEILTRGLVGEKRLRVVDLAELARTLDAWERSPQTLPARRPPAPRQAGRSVAELVSAGGARPEHLVVDARSLAADDGREEAAPIAAVAAAPPALAPPVAAPVVTDTGRQRALPPPLPPELSPAPQAASLSQLASQLPRQPTPPPLPIQPSMVARISKRLSFNPFERKRRIWPVVVVAAAAGGIGVYLAVATTQEAPAASAVPAQTAPAPAPKARAPEKAKRSASEERESCVRSHFPERKFEPSVDFAFVCEDGDFREVSHRLFSTVNQLPLADAPAGGAKPSAGGDLGWYELPATGIMRRACCASAPPVILPETPGWCEQLQSAVRQIADDSGRSGDLAPSARSFDKAVTCLFANHIARPYSYGGSPTPGQRAAFQRFLSLAAISEAKR